MNRSALRYLVIGVCLTALLLAHGSAWAQKFTPPKAKKPSAAAAEPAPPQTPQEVDAYMGGLTDEQARKALARTMKQQLGKGQGADGEVKRGMDAGLGLRFTRLTDGVSALRQKLGGTVSSAEVESEDNFATRLGKADGRRRAAEVRADAAVARRDPGLRFPGAPAIFPRHARPRRLDGDLRQAGKAGVPWPGGGAPDPAGRGARGVRRRHVRSVRAHVPEGRPRLRVGLACTWSSPTTCWCSPLRPGSSLPPAHPRYGCSRCRRTMRAWSIGGC